MRANLHTHYHRLLDSPDPLTRATARFQLERLSATRRTSDPRGRPAPWGSALPELFQQLGNDVRDRGTGQVETGHQPWHTSRSGACVVIDIARGLWYCRSCRTGGTALSFVMAWRGCTAAAAREWLAEHYGRPAGEQQRRGRRSGIVRLPL